MKDKDLREALKVWHTPRSEQEDLFEMVQETLVLSEEIKVLQKLIDEKQSEIIRQLFLVKAKILD